MNFAELTQLCTQALYLALLLSLPVLAVSLVVGLALGLMQSMTQVQEQTLTFLPKLAAVGITLVVLGGWIAHELLRFTQHLWSDLGAHIR